MRAIGLGLVALTICLIFTAGCATQKEVIKKSIQEEVTKEPSPNRKCSVDSDCKFTCNCGCININEECKELALDCSMPPGDCKCIDKICQFVEKEGWRS